ncbi:MAG: hypothetical protein ACI841_003235 [Planctomycetota bacterium]|jgi:hypothetical protein
MTERRPQDRGEMPDSAGSHEVRQSSSARTIRDRDDRLKPYDPKRIEEAVQRAQADAGEGDATFAREVSGVVGMTLESRYPTPRRRPPLRSGEMWSEPEADLFSLQTPTVDDLLDLAEETLIQMGRARTAKAFILDRDRRTRARRALEVHGPRARVSDEDAQQLDVDSGPLTSPWQRDSWDKQRLAHSLVAHCDLPLEIAEEVAERVEERLVLARFKRLSPRVVDAFAEAELLAMGFAEEAHRRSSFSIKREAISDWLRDRGHSLHGRAASALLAPHARTVLFEDLLPRAAANAIRSGVVYIEDAGCPTGPLVRVLPQTLVHEGAADIRLLTGLAPLLAACRGELVLSGFEIAVEQDAGQLLELLRALSALATAHGVRVGLVEPRCDEGRIETLIVALTHLDALRLSSEEPCSLRLFATATDVDSIAAAGGELRGSLERLLDSGAVVPVWGDEQERWLAPGVRRRFGDDQPAGLSICVAAVCLNLPRLARRAGAWREDLLFEHLVDCIDQAMEIHKSIDSLCSRSASRNSAWSEARSYAITPVGLTEAARILSDGAVSLDIGARLLALLDEATRRFAREQGLDVVLSPFFGARAAVAFAESDARERLERQARLFADMPVPESAPLLCYQSGFPVVPLGEGDCDPAMPGSEDAALSTPQVDAWCEQAYGRLRSGALLSHTATLSASPMPTLDSWLRLSAAQSSIQSERPEALASERSGQDSTARTDGPAADNPAGLFQSSPGIAPE